MAIRIVLVLVLGITVAKNDGNELVVKKAMILVIKTLVAVVAIARLQLSL